MHIPSNKIKIIHSCERPFQNQKYRWKYDVLNKKIKFIRSFFYEKIVKLTLLEFLSPFLELVGISRILHSEIMPILLYWAF